MQIANHFLITTFKAFKTFKQLLLKIGKLSKIFANCTNDVNCKTYKKIAIIFNKNI